VTAAPESKGHIRLTAEEKAEILTRYAAALAQDPLFRARLREIKRRREAGELIEEDTHIVDDSAHARKSG
jgi:hypothetical protein